MSKKKTKKPFIEAKPENEEAKTEKETETRPVNRFSLRLQRQREIM